MKRSQQAKGILAIALIVTFTLQPIQLVSALFIERPSGSIDLRLLGRDENGTTNGEASVGLGVNVKQYEKDGEYDPKDHLRLNVTTTANSRIGVNYTSSDSVPYWWVGEGLLDPKIENVGIGDEAVISFNMSTVISNFGVRFYGGGIDLVSSTQSAIYNTVFISSNGFLSFDNSTSSSPTLSPIPNKAKPNALIAAVWCDLSIDSNASIVYGFYTFQSTDYFVVIWRNALHKSSGQRLTFEIIMENAPGYNPPERRCHQSWIWLSWQTASPINTYFTYGIEDQLGMEGLGWSPNGACLGDLAGKSRLFEQATSTYFLKKLTMSFQDANPYTFFRIEKECPSISGFHMKRDWAKPEQNGDIGNWATALAGTGTLLIDVAAAAGSQLALRLSGAGLIVDGILVGLELVDLLASRQETGRQVEVSDWPTTGSTNWASIAGFVDDYAVDASLSAMVDWILDTEDTVAHSLTINATLLYSEYRSDGGVIDKQVATSLNVKIGFDNNNNQSTVEPIGSGINYTNRYLGTNDPTDYYKIHVNQGYTIRVCAGASYPWPGQTSPIPNFYLYLYDPSGIQRNPNPYYGTFHNFSISDAMGGDWYIVAQLANNQGFYWLRADCDPPGSHPGGVPWPGGACPYLYVYNGIEYVCEGLLDIHNPEGLDVKACHILQSIPYRINGTYVLRLVEHMQTHSRIDQVKLYATLEGGTTIQLPLIGAWHSENGFVLPQLLFSDDWKTEILGADWNNGTSQSINLRFLALPQWINVTGFIFQIEGNNPVWKR
jgi:hypothetical protein